MRNLLVTQQSTRCSEIVERSDWTWSLHESYFSFWYRCQTHRHILLVFYCWILDSESDFDISLISLCCQCNVFTIFVSSFPFFLRLFCFVFPVLDRHVQILSSLAWVCVENFDRRNDMALKFLNDLHVQRRIEIKADRKIPSKVMSNF